MYQLQQVLNIIDPFTSKLKIDFYTSLFSNLDLSSIPEFPPSKFGPTDYSRHALFRAIIVIKAEKFGEISDLIDYLSNNLIIAHLCGFDITKRIVNFVFILFLMILLIKIMSFIEDIKITLLLIVCLVFLLLK
nr:transposase [Thermoanaerobacterium sp. R66]